MNYTKVVRYISIERASHTLLYSRAATVIVAVGKCYVQYVVS